MAFVEINWRPPRRDLRVFSVLLIAFSAFLSWRFEGSLIQTVAVIGAVLGIAGLVEPRIARPVYVGWMVAVSPIAFVVSFLILASVFFLVVLPLAVLMRFRHRDALKLKVDRSTTTYWLPRQTQRDPRRYFRQY